MVDRRFSGIFPLQFLRLNVRLFIPGLKVVIVISADKGRWEEYHTGTLYLSAFSGPVEGILLIVVIYLITALHPSGPAFWDTPIVSLVPGEYGVKFAQFVDKALSSFGLRYKLQHLGVNVAFMIFGALGTIGNITNRYVQFLLFIS